MPDTITTNMGLTAPGVGTSPGPAYASIYNNDLTLLDQHDHSTGKGVAITPSGLNINTDLPFAQNNATQLRSVRFQAQASPITGSSTSDVGCVYVAGSDLYFNDVNGNQVRLTSGGGVAGSPGSITNLTAPATATYVSAAQTFVWQSDANVAAIMDMRSAILRNAAASSFGLTLSAPTLGADTTQTLPQTPGATSFVTMDNAGAMATSIPQSLGITRPMQAAVGQQISASCGVFIVSSTSYGTIGSLSVSITTTGRPVMVMAIADGSASPNDASIGATNAVGGIIQAGFGFFRDASQISTNLLSVSGSGSSAVATWAPGSINFLDAPAAGTYTYSLRAKATVTGTARATLVKLVAYEL